LDYIALGKSNLLVSRTAFGAMALNKIEDSSEVDALISQAYEGGVNFYDTARSSPESERRLGKAVKPYRKDVFIATKTAARTISELKTDLYASLDALGVDYIDLFQLERNDVLPEKGGEDGLVDELIDLRREGCINHFGVVTESYDIASRVVKSQSGWETLQFPFNMLCDESVEQLAMQCAEKEIGFIAMRPLCGGILTNIPLALGYLHQFENVVPAWGIRTAEEMQQILYFTANPPVIDEQFRQEAEKIRDFFN